MLEKWTPRPVCRLGLSGGQLTALNVRWPTGPVSHSRQYQRVQIVCGAVASVLWDARPIIVGAGNQAAARKGLSRDVVSGQFEAGQKLTSHKLTKWLGTSDMPVRSALLRVQALNRGRRRYRPRRNPAQRPAGAECCPSHYGSGRRKLLSQTKQVPTRSRQAMDARLYR